MCRMIDAGRGVEWHVGPPQCRAKAAAERRRHVVSRSRQARAIHDLAAQVEHELAQFTVSTLHRALRARHCAWLSRASGCELRVVHARCTVCHEAIDDVVGVCETTTQPTLPCVLLSLLLLLATLGMGLVLQAAVHRAISAGGALLCIGGGAFFMAGMLAVCEEVGAFQGPLLETEHVVHYVLLTRPGHCCSARLARLVRQYG